MKDDDTRLQMMGCEYTLSPFAARKLRESLMLAVVLMDSPDTTTPLHPNAYRQRMVSRF